MSEWFADHVSGECGVVGETGWSVIVDGSTFSFFCWQTFPNGRRAFCASDRDESQTFRHEELEQQTRPIIHSHVHSPLAPHPPNLSIHVWRCILRSHTMVFTVCCQSIQTPIASKVNVRLRSQKENKKQNAWKQCRFTVLLHYRWCWNRKGLEEVICDWIIVVELCVFKAQGTSLCMKAESRQRDCRESWQMETQSSCHRDERWKAEQWLLRRVLVELDRQAETDTYRGLASFWCTHVH